MSSHRASMAIDSSTRTRPLSPDHRQYPLARHVVERRLHAAQDVVVDLIEVWIRAELLAHVHRVKRADADLGGQGYVAEHVAHVQPPGSASEIGSTFRRNVLSSRSS